MFVVVVEPPMSAVTYGQNPNSLSLYKKSMVQMMNERADGENGSALKSPGEDPVIGQIPLVFAVF